MTNQERAEKILGSIHLQQASGGNSLSFIIEQLDEAQKEALASSQRQNDWQIGYDKGFAVARKTAASIASEMEYFAVAVALLAMKAKI